MPTESPHVKRSERHFPCLFDPPVIPAISKPADLTQKLLKLSSITDKRSKDTTYLGFKTLRGDKGPNTAIGLEGFSGLFRLSGDEGSCGPKTAIGEEGLLGEDGLLDNAKAKRGEALEWRI